MKRFLAIALVLTLVLSMGLTAFATVPDSAYYDVTQVTINKDVNLTNEGTVNPAETFSFTVGDGVVTGPGTTGVTAPDIGNFTIAVGKGETTGSTNIDLPTFTHVGIYTYPITEDYGDTAGMDYDEETYYLQVTVINDPDNPGELLNVITLVDGNDVKTDAFQNQFLAGDLLITKEITGNFAVYDDEFDVTVTLTPVSGEVIEEDPITVSGAVDDGGTVVKNADGTVTVTFKVTNESEVTIANIPYGVSYEVTEEAGEYDETITDNDDGVIDGASQSVNILNELNQEINTGINLDNLPYILILVGAALGLVGFTMKRRLSNEE